MNRRSKQCLAAFGLGLASALFALAGLSQLSLPLILVAAGLLVATLIMGLLGRRRARKLGLRGQEFAATGMGIAIAVAAVTFFLLPYG